MNIISQIEDDMKAQISAALGDTVRVVDTLPGPWSYDLLVRILQKAPCVYVAFIGGVQDLKAGNVATLKGKFDVYIISKEADEETRRRGNKRVIGCYDMLAAIIPELHGHDAADVGSLNFTGIDNLFGDGVFALGGTVYAANFEIPNMPFERVAPVLDSFVTFATESTLAADAPKTLGEKQLI